MSRKSTFLNRPPSTWEEDIEILAQTRLFLVSRVGPTGFIVKAGDMSSPTYKVFIGDNQMCSCGGGGSGKLCIHLLFVMLKVLRVPADNPLSWQLSLVESEVSKIISEGFQGQKTDKTKFSYLRKGYSASRDELKGCKTNNHTKVVRRDLDICGICQEDMTNDELRRDALCYCEVQCGTNFHKKCFRMFAAFKRTKKEKVTCPICRSKWIKIPELKRTTRTYKMKPTRCGGNCRTLIRDEIYRCASCRKDPAFNLCRRCFETGKFSSAHTFCCFVKTSTKGHATPNWEPAIFPGDQRPISNDLMNREFTDYDYDFLLSLDDGNKPTLVSHLMKALTPHTSETSTGGDLSRIPLHCNENHYLELSCLSDLLMDSSANSRLGAIGAKCPLCVEGSWLFPNLIPGVRVEVKQKCTTSNSTASGKEGNRSEIKEGNNNVDDVGIEQISLQGLSIQNMSNSELIGRRMLVQRRSTSNKPYVHGRQAKGDKVDTEMSAARRPTNIEIFGRQFQPK